MKLVIQRVLQADVTVNQKIVGKISNGLLVFLGIGHDDTEDTVQKAVNKLIPLRIFDDENGKTNLSIIDTKGELLIISQFTLLADCRKGHRPSFTDAAKPDLANHLYEVFLEECTKRVPVVQSGIFGADMKVSLINDGPFTFTLEF